MQEERDTRVLADYPFTGVAGEQADHLQMMASERVFRNLRRYIVDKNNSKKVKSSALR